MSAGINRPWQRSRSRNDVPTSNESALAEWVDWYRVPLRGIRLGRDRVRAANDGAGSLRADLRAVSRDQVPGRCSRTRAHRRQLHERVGKPRRRRAARVHPKAHYTQGFTHTGAPIIANGVVVSGINGCELFTDDGCFITGHDPATGAELWRTSTVALPGDPKQRFVEGHASTLAWRWRYMDSGQLRSGPGPVFIGTSSAKPWVATSRGMSAANDALYTNSTLALNPRTGEIEWYFQHLPGETRRCL